MNSSAVISAPHANPLGVSFTRVSKRYGRLLALRSVSLEIGAGEFVVLLGANGSGKSTLLRVAAGVARPTSGAVAYTAKNGETVTDAVAVKRAMGMVGHGGLTYDELTAEENLYFFGRLYGVEQVEQRITELLSAVGLRERRDSLVRTFSRGMRQRLAIARALVPGPGLLLLDEPATGLDNAGADWLTDFLHGFQAAGGTVLMSVHGASSLRDLATRTVTLHAGSVVSDVEGGV